MHMLMGVRAEYRSGADGSGFRIRLECDIDHVGERQLIEKMLRREVLLRIGKDSTLIAPETRVQALLALLREIEKSLIGVNLRLDGYESLESAPVYAAEAEEQPRFCLIDCRFELLSDLADIQHEAMVSTAPMRPIETEEPGRYRFEPADRRKYAGALPSYPNRKKSPFKRFMDKFQPSFGAGQREETRQDSPPPKKAAPRAGSRQEVPQDTVPNDLSALRMEQPEWRTGTLADFEELGRLIPSGTGLQTYRCPQQADKGPVPVRTSEVQFRAAAPHAVLPGDSFILNVMMYEEAYRQQVEEMITKAIEKQTEDENGIFDVALQSRVRVTLLSEDIDMTGMSKETIWRGKLAKLSFMPRVPEDYPHRQIRIEAQVQVNDAALLDLMLVLSVSESLQEAKIYRGAPKRVFVSYSRDDIDEVRKRLQGVTVALPELEIFLDKRNLKPGVEWEKMIEKEILRCDKFYLFWSPNARDSVYVNREIKFVLAHKGLRAVMPVPLQEPDECPPPPELDKLHFDDWTMAYARSSMLRRQGEEVGEAYGKHVEFGGLFY